MDVVIAVASIAIGVALLWGCGNELVTWLRLRRSKVRTTGIVVGHGDTGGPGTTRRYGVFEFTTETGQVIQASSSASTPRGPKIGRRIPIVYDPADPQGTAERPGVISIKIALLPVLLLFGAFLVFSGAAALT